MKQMTLEEISKAAASGAFRKIPVSREIYSDIRTPVETLKVLQGVSSHCYMLESVEDKKQWGRYTFLGYDPSLELTCVNGNLTITADAAEMKKVEDIPESHEEQLPTGQIRLTAKTAHPGAVIKTLIEKNKSPKIATLPTFTGGLVGYFSYDYIKYSEPTLKLDAEDQERFKDVDLMLFDKVIAYDNYRQKIVLMLNIETENLEENYEKAVQELEKMEELIRFGKPAETKAGHLKSEFRPLFDEKAYCEKVEQVKHYIHEGDLFQLVLSNRLEADFEGSLLDTYRVLRTTNPSPYMFYFSSDDMSLCDFFIVQHFFKLCHICLMLFENLRGLHFHIGIIRHLREILHQEINILLDSPDGSFQRRIVDFVDAFLRSRAALRVQNLVHDLLAVRKIGSGKTVHIGITDFELPGQDLLFRTGHHLLHDLHAPHELFRADNIGFTDVVPLCNLLAAAEQSFWYFYK